jgi:DNA (cytosine-5)-methyltransferase 1
MMRSKNPDRLNAVFKTLEAAAVAGRRCPENGQHGVTSDIVVALAHAGRIRIEISNKNWPRVVFLENVEEFREWGPLLENGKRCPVQRGVIFKQFVASWEALGYKVEWRERRAWRAGKKMQAATIRKRLYVIMRRDGEPIIWPEAAFGNPNDPIDAQKIAAGLLKPWKTAADCIDWSLPCPSIFDTAAEIKAKYGLRAIRPLKHNTMGRVAKGTSRYVIKNDRPFIVSIGGTASPAAPFVTKFNQNATGHSALEPLHTITSHASDYHGGGAAPLGIVAPVLVRIAHGEVGANGKRRGRGDHSANELLPTVLGTNDVAVAAVHLSTMRNAQKPFNEADKPMHAPTAGGATNTVVAAFMAKHFGGHESPGAPLAEPGPTVTTIDHNAVVAAQIVNLRGTDRRGGPADQPVHTLSAQGTHAALAMAFLSKYYSAGVPSQDVGDPLHTDTAKPRFGLVEALAAVPPFGPDHYEKARKVADLLREFGYWDDREFVTIEVAPGVTAVIVDLGMRMLTPRERFTAQGFRPDYIIDRGILEDGSIIKFTAEQQGYMCGNSVCPPEAEDLIGANYQPRKVARPTPRHPQTFPLLEAAE